MLVPASELEALLDALPDVVFFIKDTAGRYTHANLTLVRRLGLKRRDEVIGRSVTELFTAARAVPTRGRTSACCWAKRWKTSLRCTSSPTARPVGA